ncbi:MAG: arginine deiminase family protein [Bryobacteraceae bacterium]
MNRRSFLFVSLAGAAGRAGWAAESGPFVSSDVGELKSVLVHTPGKEGRRGLGLGQGSASLGNQPLSEEAAEEHRAFTQALRQGGAETVEIRQVLDEAATAARSKGALQPWLRAWMPAMAPYESDVNGEVLLGAVDKFAYHTDPEGDFLPLNEPVRSIYFSRDAGVMTPKGMVICNFLNEGRTIEAALYRFMFDHAPRFAKFPVVFDAGEQRVTLEGGDMMVVDPRTIFLGVGNRTNPAAARRLAQALGMDVLAVQMPSGGNSKRWSDPATRTPVHNLMLHLDTIATFVDRKKVLTLPWFLESKYEGKDPLTRMLRGLAKSPRVADGDVEKMCSALKDLGKVKLFRAGSGDQDRSVDGMKLVDYLRARGYDVIFTGGDRPADTEPFEDIAQFTSEVVIRELHGQGANVVATGPGKVVAYGGNPRTMAALKKAGVEVTTFRGVELGRNNGGPHCMTMPLERKP